MRTRASPTYKIGTALLYPRRGTPVGLYRLGLRYIKAKGLAKARSHCFIRLFKSGNDVTVGSI